MKHNKIISAQNISIGYGKSKDAHGLHQNLSFSLYEGELTCLLGANGSGKSTLLRTLSANQSALDGNIYFNEKDITTYKEKDLSQLMGLVLTDKTNVGGLTVRELVSLGRYPYTGFFGKLSKTDYEIVDKAMLDVNIAHKSTSYVAELSDGERQKAMIAKAISQECPVLLLDEPTAFLDIEGRIDIMNLLHDLTTTQGKTILLSTHDIDLALRLADRLWLLSKDNGLYTGVTEDVVVSGKLDRFFTGENIIFEKESGNFSPKEKGLIKAAVRADGYTKHWYRNILQRRGFQITDNEKDATIVIESSVSNEINIIKDDEKYTFDNFEKVAEWLQNYNKQM